MQYGRCRLLKAWGHQCTDGRENAADCYIEYNTSAPVRRDYSRPPLSDISPATLALLSRRTGLMNSRRDCRRSRILRAYFTHYRRATYACAYRGCLKARTPDKQFPSRTCLYRLPYIYIKAFLYAYIHCSTSRQFHDT